MTSSRTLRPVLASMVVLALAGCGGVEDDPRRFETMAQAIADVPLDGSAPKPVERTAAVQTAEDRGLRPAHPQPLRIEVMDPHALWDARDAAAGLRHAIVEKARETATPVMADAMMDTVSNRPLKPAAAPAPLRPAIADAGRQAQVQLGAYSSAAGAREAWARLKAGRAANALGGLSPIFEPVTVAGRSLVRLKVAAPADTARALCRAADVTDPWCARHA